MLQNLAGDGVERGAECATVRRDLDLPASIRRAVTWEFMLHVAGSDLASQRRPGRVNAEADQHIVLIG